MAVKTIFSCPFGSLGLIFQVSLKIDYIFPEFGGGA